MSAEFSVIPIDHLVKIIENEYVKSKSIFGIPEELFFYPHQNDPFRIKRYGTELETPLGVAAGPHTQLAQNIISAWLCGARYIELKTVQTLDELNISKPCIDIQDEGYNCEWSQELKLDKSYLEYLKAWIIIHWLREKLKHEGDAPGMIFNMSVGYNMEGILKENVQRFINAMANSHKELEEQKSILRPLIPHIDHICIPACISDNITLSTMHGCPPEEIEGIGLYLIREKKMNTTIKLNPTLLGPDQLRAILNTKLGFETKVPDLAFEHDLKYPDAIQLIKTLQSAAIDNKVEFNIKLTNTLEAINHKDVFSTEEKMMYMSGRALHPISINVARKLQNEFDGKLDISFSGGIDAFNVCESLQCGLQPLTVCSDLLKPGGYGRLAQYIENLRDYHRSDDALTYLNQYADKVSDSDNYRKDPFKSPDIKSQKSLGMFDCIHAPCVNACATSQDIPDYLFYTSQGDFAKAFEVILKKNPFPASLGMVCDHACQTKCTRINYDDSVQIREIKRFVASHGEKEDLLKPAENNGKKVAIIGAGPSGLACAYFLRLAGFDTQIYEAKELAGGMVADAIPAFRLKKESLKKDIRRIESLGVKINYGHKTDRVFFEELRKNSDYLFVAAGAQKFMLPGIEGENLEGSLDAFSFLASAKKENNRLLAKQIIVIGGGNTAMDVARTALRLSSPGGQVKVVYRRTLKEMPADAEEIKALLEEGIEITELVAPEKITGQNGKVSGLICCRMRLGEKDASGRSKPIRIEGSDFLLPCDMVISAIGQNVDIDFADETLLNSDPETLETSIPGVYIGGDARLGAATFIKAVGDARKVARSIIQRENIAYNFNPATQQRGIEYRDYIIKKSKRARAFHAEKLTNGHLGNFEPLTTEMDHGTAIEEASRCLQCDDVCSVCVTVCPNRANHTYLSKPFRMQKFRLKSVNSQTEVIPGAWFEVTQTYQVLNIADFCNECGNCTTFCPTSGAPFRDKPRFCLSLQSFKSEETGFYLEKKKDGNVLHYKSKTGIQQLRKEKTKLIFTSGEAMIEIDASTYKVLLAKLSGDKTKEYDAAPLWPMLILMDAATEFYP